MNACVDSRLKQVELARAYYNELANIAKTSNASKIHRMVAQICLSAIDFDALDTYASSYRMCNRCFAIGKKSSRTYGKCVHCEAYYVCSQVCADAENGLDKHLGVCLKAPDVISSRKAEKAKCRRCRAEMANPKRSGCCRELKYCSTECGKKDWPRHRKFCPGKADKSAK